MKTYFEYVFYVFYRWNVHLNKSNRKIGLPEEPKVSSSIFQASVWETFNAWTLIGMLDIWLSFVPIKFYTYLPFIGLVAFNLWNYYYFSYKKQYRSVVLRKRKESFSKFWAILYLLLTFILFGIVGTYWKECYLY